MTTRPNPDTSRGEPLSPESTESLRSPVEVPEGPKATRASQRTAEAVTRPHSTPDGTRNADTEPRTPLSDERLAAIDAAVADYEKHPDLGFACCSAHPAADAAQELLAEVAAVRAERDQAQPETPDTLPAWLYQRFAVIHGCPAWDTLTDDDRTYWEHHARAVRRAVARGGFKTGEVPA